MGGRPSGWSASTDTPGSTGIEEWRINNSGAPVNGLLMVRDGGAYRSNVYYNGEGATGFTDYQGAVTFSMSGNNAIGGVLLRLNSTGRNLTQGYFVGIQTQTSSSSDPHRLFISMDPTHHTNPGAVLDQAGLDFAIGSAVMGLEFSVIGNSITGALYLWNEDTDAWDASPVASVAATNDTYASGRVGLRGAFGQDNHYVQFANFSISTIPEPGAYAFAVGVLGLFAVLYGKRKTRDSI